MAIDLNNELATKPHYPILDGFRGVAAIIVVTFHLAEPLATGHLDILVNHDEPVRKWLRKKLSAISTFPTPLRW